MSGSWVLPETTRSAWKQHIDGLRGEHTLDSLTTAMGLVNGKSELSKFSNGDERTLRRWFETRPEKYIEPFVAEVGTTKDALLTRFRGLQSGLSMDIAEADWHPAFPTVSREAAFVEPSWRGQSIDDLKSWQEEHDQPIKVIGLPGSGRRTLVAWLETQKVTATIDGRPSRGKLPDGAIQIERWTPAQVSALAGRLAAVESLPAPARQHLGAFRERLQSEPALARLVDDPDGVIKLLAQVAQRGVPKARGLREELLRAEWARFRASSTTGWNTLVQEETVEALLLEGFLDGATDRVGWTEVAERIVPRNVNLADLEAELDRLVTAPPRSREAAVGRLRQRLVGWSSGPVVEALLESGWLLDGDLGVHPARWPLALSRMARAIVERPHSGWFGRCGHRPEAIELVRECAVWGLSWERLKAELRRAPEALRLDVAAAAVAFAAQGENHRQVAGDRWFVEQWASALWGSVAGVPVMGERLGVMYWGLDNALTKLFDPKWTSNADLMRLSVQMAGELPPLHGDDSLGALAAHVPAATRALVGAWYDAPFPPEPMEAETTQAEVSLESTSRSVYDGHLQMLAHLAPAQCIPKKVGLLFHWHFDGRPESYFLDAWERAAEAGDPTAARCLALSRRKPYAERWLGRVQPDREQLDRVWQHLNLFDPETDLAEERVIKLLERFPDEMLGRALLNHPYAWEGARLAQLISLAEAVGNRTVLRHFADFDARCADFWVSHWTRSRARLSSWLQVFVETDRHAETTRAHAMRARIVLHTLGEPDLLRAWALESIECERPASLGMWDRVAAGARLFGPRTPWETLSERLPDEPRCRALLDEVRKTINWVFSPSPFTELLLIALDSGCLGPLEAVIEHEATDGALEWRFERHALYPLKARSAETDGPQVLLAAVLLLWRQLNTHDNPGLVGFLASLVEPFEAPRWSDRWLVDVRRDAIDALVERRDPVILQRLFEYDGGLQELAEWRDLVAGRVADKRHDEEVKAWILSQDPPERIREWLEPPPSKWVPNDAFFEDVDTQSERVSIAHQSDDPRARPLMRALLNEAREVGELSAELFWSRRLKIPLDDLVERWLAKADVFEGPSELSAMREGDTVRFSGGWLLILKALGEMRRVETLVQLGEIASTEKVDTLSRRQLDWRNTYQLDVDYGPLRYKSSSAHQVGAALEMCATPDELLALGHAPLQRLGLESFWRWNAPAPEVLGVLADASSTVSDRFYLLEALVHREDEATFAWLEANLAARYDWTPTPIAFDGDRRLRWENQLDLLLRWRPRRAWRILDRIEATFDPVPDHFIGELAPWADDPQVGARLRRWMHARTA